MNKFLTLITTLTIATSCNIEGSHKQTRTNKKLVGVGANQVSAIEYQYVVIDSCEYIFGIQTQQVMITHKGNCVFCEARKK